MSLILGEDPPLYGGNQLIPHATCAYVVDALADGPTEHDLQAVIRPHIRGCPDCAIAYANFYDPGGAPSGAA